MKQATENPLMKATEIMLRKRLVYHMTRLLVYGTSFWVMYYAVFNWPVGENRVEAVAMVLASVYILSVAILFCSVVVFTVGTLKYSCLWVGELLQARHLPANG